MKKFEKLDPNKIFFISDTHFGHKNIIKYCGRPFSSVEEMNEKLIENWNKVVGDDCTVFHLGDFALGGQDTWYKVRPQLRGSIRLILGNHDIQVWKPGFEKLFDEVTIQKHIYLDNHKIYLNHFPFLCFDGSWDESTVQLFGHVHVASNPEYSPETDRLKYLFKTQYNVCCEYNNFTPISWNQIKEKLYGSKE